MYTNTNIYTHTHKYIYFCFKYIRSFNVSCTYPCTFYVVCCTDKHMSMYTCIYILIYIYMQFQCIVRLSLHILRGTPRRCGTRGSPCQRSGSRHFAGVYIDIYKYLCICVYTYIHIHMYICIYAGIHMYMYAYIYMYSLCSALRLCSTRGSPCQRSRSKHFAGVYI